MKSIFTLPPRVRRFGFYVAFMMLVHFITVLFGLEGAHKITFNDLIFIAALVTWLEEGEDK